MTGKAVEVGTPVAKSAISAASAAAASDPTLFLTSAAAFAAFVVLSPAIFGLIASCVPWKCNPALSGSEWRHAEPHSAQGCESRCVLVLAV